jgi:HTH-type transcriptional regulator/antitoxin HipB
MEQTLRTQKQLGAELRRCRKKLGMSQAQLGRLIDMRQATISNLETEGSGTLETLYAVLSALNLELTIRARSQTDRTKIGEIF